MDPLTTIFLLLLSEDVNSTSETIVITEIMQNPAAVADATGEWFELYNGSSQPVDLHNWVIRDDVDELESHVIATSLVVPAGGFVLFAVSDNPSFNGGIDPDYIYSDVNLANGLDGLVIEDGNGALIDQVIWDGGPNFPDPSGISMNLDPGSFDTAGNDDGANWCGAVSAFGAGDLGTPGAANDPCPQPGDIVINEIMQNPSAGSDATAEWFEVYNSTGATIDLENWIISDLIASHEISSSVPVPPGGYAVFAVNGDPGANGGLDEDYVYVDIFLNNTTDRLSIETPSGALIDEVEWDDGATFPDPDGASMSLDPDSQDAVANDTGANWCGAITPYGLGDFGTPGDPNDPCPQPGDIIITEVMQDPTGTDTNEWFELYNTTGSAIDLDNWIIRDDDVPEQNHVIGSSVIVPAGGFVVMAQNGDFGTNGGLVEDYVYTVIELGNATDGLRIETPAAELIDQVIWDGGPNFPDPTGASMNLDPASFNGVDNDAGANWCTSTSSYGTGGELGTPGAANENCQ